LGAILYELLTGRPPFRGDTQVGVILRVVSEDPEPPRRVEPSCPPDLEAVCLKCLQKAPAARYASAGALADDLARFRAGEPTQARPATRAERFRRWFWRRRWRVAGVTVAACLLLALVCSLALNAFALLSIGQVNTSMPPPRVEGADQPVDEPPVALTEALDLVPRDAVEFAHFRVGDLWKRQDVRGLNQLLARAKLPGPDEWLSDIGKPLGAGPADLESLTVLNLAPPQEQAVNVFLFTTAQPHPSDQLREQLKARGLKAQQFRGETYFAGGPSGENIFLCSDHTFVSAEREDGLREWILRRPQPDSGGLLRPALDLAARGHHIVVGFSLLPKHGQGLLYKINLPPKLEQPDLLPLEDAKIAILSADFLSRAEGAATDGMDMTLRLDYPDGADESKRLEALTRLRDFMTAVLRYYARGEGDGPPVIAEELALAMPTAHVEQHGAAGRMTLRMEWEPDWPARAVAAVKVEDDRVRSLNNLKQLSVAMHDYHDQFGHFPTAAIADKAGKPLLSWRVEILPFLGEQDLYKQFKLDEAWDGPNNVKLVQKMPAVYAPHFWPLGGGPDMTFYQVFVGEQTMFPPGKPLRFQDITDGTSNTLMIVEAGEAVPWTKPADLPYDPGLPLPMLGGIFDDGFQAAFADGRTGRFFPKTTPPTTLRALITPRGGEELPPP
jgi:hypothetical protein